MVDDPHDLSLIINRLKHKNVLSLFKKKRETEREKENRITLEMGKLSIV